MKIKFGGVAALLVFAVCHPATAHHGRDFLLLETDDMPAKGESYFVASVDTIRTADERATEITPGLVLRAGNRVAVEPHFHIAREPGESFRYAASSVGVRLRLGDIGKTGWRAAISGEVEVTRNRAAEPTGGTFRLIAARTLPRALVAANVIVGHEFTAGGASDYALGLGAATPLSNGDQVGIEGVFSLPLRDGIEILPSYSHRFGKRTLGKIGVGVFHARGFTSGTLHAQLVQRF